MRKPQHLDGKNKISPGLKKVSLVFGVGNMSGRPLGECLERAEMRGVMLKCPQDNGCSQMFTSNSIEIWWDLKETVSVCL